MQGLKEFEIEKQKLKFREFFRPKFNTSRPCFIKPSLCLSSHEKRNKLVRFSLTKGSPLSLLFVTRFQTVLGAKRHSFLTLPSNIKLGLKCSTDKHASLLQQVINDQDKSFYCLGSREGSGIREKCYE